LSVESDEKVAIVGPNGAGKSTLLHLIAGFRMPFTGDVAVNGMTLNESNADGVRRKLGLLFQDPDDQIFMPTVEEDIAFGPRNLKLQDVGERTVKAMRSTGIEHLAKRRPHRLSFGMKKRVAIAGILAMDPEVLLLDEPTSGLDPRSRAGLISLLKGMKRTMLIATHDLDAAAEIADRVLVLNVSPVAQGTMSELVGSKGVLEQSGLEAPQISRLFDSICEMGYAVETIPVTKDQAVAELERIIERERRKRVASRVPE
jgi:cobalt/nickel transport system ATP-binding protein